MTVRCKFQLVSRREDCFNKDKRTLVFETRYDATIPDDKRFMKATPDGTMTMGVDNPQVLSQFKLGEFYYFDISVAPRDGA